MSFNWIHKSFCYPHPLPDLSQFKNWGRGRGVVGLAYLMYISPSPLEKLQTNKVDYIAIFSSVQSSYEESQVWHTQQSNIHVTYPRHRYLTNTHIQYGGAPFIIEVPRRWRSGLERSPRKRKVRCSNPSRDRTKS